MRGYSLGDVVAKFEERIFMTTIITEVYAALTAAARPWARCCVARAARISAGLTISKRRMRRAHVVKKTEISW